MNLQKPPHKIFQTFWKIKLKNKFTILGCGSSLGSPWITSYKGKLSKKKKILELDVVLIYKKEIYQFL